MNSTLLTDLAAELMLMPEKISVLQLEILTLDEKLNLTSTRLELEELKLKMEIADAVDSNGKKLHSNEDSRRAALAEKKEESELIQDLIKEELDLQHKIQRMKIDLERAIHTQRNVRSILSFFSSGVSIDSSVFDQ